MWTLTISKLAQTMSSLFHGKRFGKASVDFDDEDDGDLDEDFFLVVTISRTTVCFVVGDADGGTRRLNLKYYRD